MVIWLTGLSGSGKTTVGRLLTGMWRQRADNVVHLDGDDIRRVLGLDGSDELYTLEGRRMVAGRISDLCAWLDGQGIHVVVSTISAFPEIQQRNRKNLSRYFEVFIDVPMDVLARRDIKGLYADARSGKIANVVGIDLPFEPPASPDMTIDNQTDRDDLAGVAREVLSRALSGEAPA